MKNLMRNKKAISAVLSTIIIVAVTISATLIAAAWFFGLIPGFQKTAQITLSAEFLTGGEQINLTIHNFGASSITFTQLKINEVTQTTISPALPVTVSGNSDKTLTVNCTWTAGNTYRFELRTDAGQPIIYETRA
jgi:hypothetical protein